MFRHVAVALLSRPCVTASPEHLIVPCTERTLLCLLNGGVRFVCFQVLAVVNTVTLNIYVRFLPEHNFNFSGMKT